MVRRAGGIALAVLAIGAVRHKGRPDEEERPARFSPPVDPDLYERVQVIRAERRTRHPGMTTRRSYPLVRLMRCVRCGSQYHGDANAGRRRIRHARRPACGGSATYRAERYESQLARLLDGIRFDESDIRQVLAAMRRLAQPSAPPKPGELHAGRAALQKRLAAGELSIDAFSRAWRGLERPQAGTGVPLDESRLRGARKLLRQFGTLWRDPAVPDRLREEAVREIFLRFDVDGSDLVAVHPQPNENAWLLGQASLRNGSLLAQQQVGLVGARGIAPP